MIRAWLRRSGRETVAFVLVLGGVIALVILTKH